MSGKTLVILGGGTGGLVLANRLRRMIGREHRVLLVDRNPVYYFAPSFTWLMIGQRGAQHISRDLRRLEKRGVEVIIDEVLGIDAAAGKVTLRGRYLDFDYLVIALGAQYSSDEIPGLGRCWTFYHVEGAEGLQERLAQFRSGRIAIVVSSLPYKCPPAPYEGAFLLDAYFRGRGLRDDIDIHVYTPEPFPLTAAGEHVGQRIMEMLARRGIGFTAGANLAEVDHRSRRLRFRDGLEASFDLPIATPIHNPPDVLRSSGLCAESGWVRVDRETLATSFERVFAIGDATEIPLAHGASLPKAGVFAHGQAEVVARNLAAELSGGQPIWAFGGHGACFLETGNGKAAYVSGHFYAEPRPDVVIRSPSRIWHWAKLGFERMWLWRWF